jgi:hypothetical protein
MNTFLACPCILNEFDAVFKKEVGYIVFVILLCKTKYFKSEYLSVGINSEAAWNLIENDYHLRL